MSTPKHDAADILLSCLIAEYRFTKTGSHYSELHGVLDDMSPSRAEAVKKQYLKLIERSARPVIKILEKAECEMGPMPWEGE